MSDLEFMALVKEAQQRLEAVDRLLDTVEAKCEEAESSAA